MARLPRFTVPGQLHLVLQRGHGAQPVFVDSDDVDAYLKALHDVAREWRVLVHAFGFSGSELRLLVTPADVQGLSKLMQSMSRRHAAWINRRHGRSGTPWQGRFASTPVEAGAGLFEVMRFVEIADDPAAIRTSADHHRGAVALRGLVDPAGYWALGNTPFDRETAYRRLAELPLTPERAASLKASALNGWPVGTATFVLATSSQHQRRSGPAKRGRPRRPARVPQVGADLTK